MKSKTVVVSLALIILVARLAAASSLDVDFSGNGWLDVFFEGHDVSWVSIDSTTGSSDLGIRDDNLLAWGDFVICMEWINPYTVDRFVAVAHGSAEFNQSHELGGYGTSVESYCGIGVLWSRRVSSDVGCSGPVTAFSTGALADSNYAISQYAAHDNPSTWVGVAQSNLAEDGLGFSEMLVSWSSNSLSSNLSNSLSFDPVEWDGGVSLGSVEWDGGVSLHLISDYKFSVDILSLWQTPAIGIEIIEYLSG